MSDDGSDGIGRDPSCRCFDFDFGVEELYSSLTYDGTKKRAISLGALFLLSAILALFSSEKISDFGTVALSFVCDKYYSIMD